ncbi:hypothetical protein BGX24_009061 [Mortierella sp. AD032]|nr:hypothetical protein BGX24_009061 [Mortierella sp. AD032]
MAQRIYLRYKEITPQLEPVNQSNLNLGDLIMDFGAETSLTMRQHYKKLPTTITDKMAKTGNTLSSSGAGESSSSTETPVEQNATLDEDENDGEAIGRFEDGHIRKWWIHYLSLKFQCRLKFIPSAEALVCVVQERGVKEILWGGSAKKNPAKACHRELEFDNVDWL